MTEYLEREKVYNLLVLLAKYETGERQQGILGCAETIRMLSAAEVACPRCGAKMDRATNDCPQKKHVL